MTMRGVLSRSNHPFSLVEWRVGCLTPGEWLRDTVSLHRCLGDLTDALESFGGETLDVLAFWHWQSPSDMADVSAQSLLHLLNFGGA